MAESALRSDPVSSEPTLFDGVTIGLADPKRRVSLRARNAEAVADLLGRSVPGRIGALDGDLLRLGPDEWLMRAAAGSDFPDGSGQPLSVVDVSERSVTMIVEGPRALDVLSAGCPRDLARIPVGEGRRTVFEGVEIILIRTADQRFEVDVWRSFAPWLNLALVTAAGHLR